MLRCRLYLLRTLRFPTGMAHTYAKVERRYILSWIETITKEDFQLAVREAMKPEMEKLDQRFERLDSKITDVENSLGNRIGNLEQ